MRNYSAVDLLRFVKFVNENPELKGLDKVRAYDKEYPELSSKQKLMNLAQHLKLKNLYKVVSGVDMPEYN